MDRWKRRFLAPVLVLAGTTVAAEVCETVDGSAYICAGAAIGSNSMTSTELASIQLEGFLPSPTGLATFSNHVEDMLSSVFGGNTTADERAQAFQREYDAVVRWSNAQISLSRNVLNTFDAEFDLLEQSGKELERALVRGILPQLRSTEFAAIQASLSEPSPFIGAWSSFDFITEARADTRYAILRDASVSILENQRLIFDLADSIPAEEMGIRRAAIGLAEHYLRLADYHNAADDHANADAYIAASNNMAAQATSDVLPQVTTIDTEAGLYRFLSSNIAPPVNGLTGDLYAISGAMLTPRLEDLATLVGLRHAEEGGNLFVVTSGLRPPARQAAAMYTKFASGGDISIYRRQDLATEIYNAYSTSIASGTMSTGEVIDAMKATIEAQVARADFVSRHIVDNAIDIRIRDLAEDDIRRLESVLDYLKLEYVREGRPPHIHVSIPNNHPLLLRRGDVTGLESTEGAATESYTPVIIDRGPFEAGIFWPSTSRMLDLEEIPLVQDCLEVQVGNTTYVTFTRRGPYGSQFALQFEEANYVQLIDQISAQGQINDQVFEVSVASEYLATLAADGTRFTLLLGENLGGEGEFVYEYCNFTLNQN